MDWQEKITPDKTYTHDQHGEVTIRASRTVGRGTITIETDGANTYARGEDSTDLLVYTTADGDEHTEPIDEFVDNTTLFDEDNE